MVNNQKVTIDTRERIVNAAAELFHQRNYSAVGINDICKQAEVVKGSFYHFFKSKEDLAIAVIDVTFAKFESMMHDFFADPGSPLGRIRKFFEFMGDAFASQKSNGNILGCPIGNLTADLSAQSESVRQRLARVFDRNMEVFARVLQEAKDAGELDEHSDVKAAAEAMVAYTQGISVLGKTYNDIHVTKRLAQHVMLLAGARTI